MRKDYETNFFVPYESAVAALERTVRRLWVLCIIVIVLFVASNIFWIYHVGQYQGITTEAEITQDFDTGQGGDITNGDVRFGETKTDD